MTDNDIFGTIVLGVATAVVSAIVISKYLSGGNGTTEQPAQGLQVQYPAVTSRSAAPVAQNSPITEAAYNTHVRSHYSAGDNHLFEAAAFGHDENGHPDQEVTLPQ